MQVPTSSTSDFIQGYLAELSQFLTGAGLGLTAGAILGFLISEWVKHNHVKAQQVHKAELDSLLEQKKTDLSKILESHKAALAGELELFKEQLKLQNTYKTGIASAIAQVASEEIAKAMDAVTVADEHLCAAFYDALAGQSSAGQKLLEFDHALFECGKTIMAPKTSQVPEQIVEHLSAYVMFLFVAGGVLRHALNTKIFDVTHVYNEFNAEKLARKEALRGALGIS